MWVTATAPSGFLVCDGSQVSRTTYASLFGVIGTTFGIGNGTTTFNLPNTQGTNVKGVGTYNTTTYALAQHQGTDFIQPTATQLPAHSHLALQPGGSAQSGGGSVAGTPNTGGVNTSDAIYSYNGTTYTQVTATQQLGALIDVRNPYLVLYYIIKYL